MKAKILTATLLFSFTMSFGQSSTIDTNEKKVTMEQRYYINKPKKGQKRRAFLGQVKKVDNSGQKLKLYGYAPKAEEQEKYPNSFQYYYNKMGRDYYLVELNRSEGYIFSLWELNLFPRINEDKWLYESIKYIVNSASIFTIPYKIRPGDGTEELKRITTSGITNAAINVDLFRYRKEQYISAGKVKKWRVSFGAMISPGVEEFPESQTRGYMENQNDEGDTEIETFKELVISSGFTINVSVNDIAFTFIPMAWDHGTTSAGKSWRYSGRRWWGFGIGLSPKFLNPASN